MEVVTLGETRKKNMKTPDNRLLYSSYYGEALAVHEGPQVFLVDMPDAGSTVHPHFHDVDQYQVIVKGSGRLGREPAEPIAFHYADAYTPYGPIVGAQDGIAFLTIRKACAAGYYPMPESRHLIAGKPGRNITGKFEINKPLPRPGESTRETLMTTEDGVEVLGLRIGPGGQAAGEPADAGDQYYLVCTGSLLHEGRAVPPMSIVRIEPGAPLPMFHAGSTGAEILLTQLPMASARPGSDPNKLAQRKIDYKLPLGMNVE